MILEGGALQKSTTEPSEEDLKAIEAGILTIVKFERNRIYDLNERGIWVEL